MNNEHYNRTYIKNRSRKYILFVIIEAVLYFLFMFIDIINSNFNFHMNSFVDFFNKTAFLSSNHLKYYSILVCLVVSIIYIFKERSKATVLLICAMGFTAISDFFLLLNSNQIIPGIAFFCAVHFIYLLVIRNGSLRNVVIPTAVRISIAYVAMFLINRTKVINIPKDSNQNILLFLILLYAVSFLGNVIRLGISNNECIFTHSSLFLLGLILFLLCDLNVLIYNLDSFIHVNSKLYDTLRNLSSFLMWGFYLPSQVLIVLSL